MARRLTVDDLIADEPDFIEAPVGRIYLITNKVNGMRYVGQTQATLRSRWLSHAKKKQDTEGSIGRAVQDFGPGAFSVMELAQASPCDLYALEEFYIAQYGTLYPAGYNLTTGGQVLSAHTCERISRSRVGLQLVSSTKRLRAGQGIRKPSEKRRKVIGTHIITGDVIELPFMSADARFDIRLVSACCRGKRRHHKGYAWRYAECDA